MTKSTTGTSAALLPVPAESIRAIVVVVRMARHAAQRLRCIAEDVFPMASKRSRKVQKRQKALQSRRRQQPPSTRRPLTQIPPEHADQLAMTTTGEIMQPIRLHYEVLDGDQLRATFARLRCLEDDIPRKRWVWLRLSKSALSR